MKEKRKNKKKRNVLEKGLRKKVNDLKSGKIDISMYQSDFLKEYHDKCFSGEIIVGREMKENLKWLILERELPEYHWDTWEAAMRMWLMENVIKLTKSPFYGKPMILMLWQKAFIQTLYSYKMGNVDRFKEAMLLISRKNTKSETSSAAGLSEFLLGPDGADIVCSSNDDLQASILYDAIDVMRQMIDPDNQDTWRNQKGITNLFNGSKIFKLSDRTKNKEGRNIDFAVIDEEHEMRTNIIVKSIQQSTSLKENPKIIHITTEGFINDGFLDKELVKARNILSREDEGISSKRYLPWLYTQDSEEEIFRDPESWQKSNPTLGIVKKWSYLEEQVDLARKSKSDRVFVLSKDFNIKQSNSTAWLMKEDYDYPSSYDMDPFHGSVVLGYVDLAQTTDLVCAMILMMRPDSNEKFILTRYFIPEIKLERSDDKASGAEYIDWAKKGWVEIQEGNEVDIASVADWFYSMYKKYKLRPLKIGYDQRYARQFIKRCDQYGFEVEVVNQNGPTLTQAAKLVESDLKQRNLNINQNPVTKWCLGNASIEISDNLGNFVLTKIGGISNKRIDGAVSLVGLYEIYRRYKSDFKNMLK